MRVAATAATFWSQLCRSWAISLTVYCAGSDSYPCPCLDNLRRGCRLQRLSRAEVPVPRYSGSRGSYAPVHPARYGACGHEDALDGDVDIVYCACQERCSRN